MTNEKISNIIHCRTKIEVRKMKDQYPTIPTATELTESYRQLSDEKKYMALGFMQALMLLEKPVKDDQRESA